MELKHRVGLPFLWQGQQEAFSSVRQEHSNGAASKQKPEAAVDQYAKAFVARLAELGHKGAGERYKTSWDQRKEHVIKWKVTVNQKKNFWRKYTINLTEKSLRIEVRCENADQINIEAIQSTDNT